MALDQDEVRRVAGLARLRLSDDELGTMTTQLDNIVLYVRQLESVETADVAPLSHALDLANVFREDAIQPGLPREAALANAPKHDGECFRVPAVLGE